MKELDSSKNTTAAPKADDRLRTNRSARLWVVKRTWNQDNTRIEICGAIESIERSIYTIEGRSGDWVRYQNRYYPMHSKQDFLLLLEDAKKKKIYFFNNESKIRDDPELNTEIAPFIYTDELGPPA